MPGLSGNLVYDPSQLAGLGSGSNLSGGPTAPISFSPVNGIGGTSSPFVPQPATGTSMPAPTTVGSGTPIAAYGSPYAPSGATSAVGALGGSPLGNSGGDPSLNLPGSLQNNLAQGFQKAGLPGGVGTAAATFLEGGAGYDPQVANALIAAMQPQIAQGQANLMGQFGAEGLAAGSPAALGLGAYNAQTNLDVGTLLSGLYEQSVQNYMQVLSLGKEPQQEGGGILGSLGSLLSGVGSAAGAVGGTGSSFGLLGLLGL